MSAVWRAIKRFDWWISDLTKSSGLHMSFLAKNYATRKAVYYALVIPDDTTIWRELFKFGRKSQEKDCWHAGTALIGNTSKCCAKAQFASISAQGDKARGKRTTLSHLRTTLSHLRTTLSHLRTTLSHQSNAGSLAQHS